MILTLLLFPIFFYIAFVQSDWVPPVARGKALISLRFDDGRTTTWNYSKDVMAEYGFVGSAYLRTNGTTPPFDDWSRAETLYADYGWELGGHTRNHNDLTSGHSAAMLENEIWGCIDDIEGNTTATVYTFAPPGNAHNATTDKYVSEKYIGQTVGAAGVLNNYPWNPYGLTIKTVTNTTTLETMKGWIDLAINGVNGSYLIIMFHDVYPDVSGSQYTTTPTIFSGLMSYINNQSSFVNVITVKDAIDFIQNAESLIPNSFMDNGVASWVYNWSRVYPSYPNASASWDTNDHGVGSTRNTSIKFMSNYTSDTHITSENISIVYGRTYYIWLYVEMLNCTNGQLNAAFQTYDTDGNFVGSQYIYGLPNPHTGFIVKAYEVSNITAIKGRIHFWAGAGGDPGRNFTAYIDHTLILTGNPLNVNVSITNLEGCGNWVFSDEQYYSFVGEYNHSQGYSYLDTVRIAFTDGVEWTNCSYDVITETFTLDCGSDVVNLQAGTITTSNQTLNATFEIYFENKILDAYNVDIWMRSNDTDGRDSGWELVQTDYFNIYSLGGYSTLTSSGDAGRLEGGDIFELYAGNNSWAEAETVYRNLQHIKMLVYLSYYGDKYEVAGLKYTFSYCTEQDEWIDPGFEIEIKPVEGKVPPSYPSDVWWQSNVYFRMNGVLIKNETIWHFIKAVSVTLPGFGTVYGTACSSLWIDIWLNRINASTVIGGRVNAYEYPMKDSADAWVKWLKTDWGPNDGLRKQTMCFETMTHDDDTALSTKEIELIKVKCLIYMNATENNEFFSATDYDIFDLTFGSEPLQGIQTPVFDETRVPVMPQGGFLGALFSQFAWFFRGLAGAFGPAILAFWDAFVGFMDTVFTTFGWPNGFSQIVNFIANLITWFSVALGYFVSLVTTGFTWITQAFSYMILGFTQFISGLGSIVSWIGWMWGQLVADWGWVLQVGVTLLPLGAIFYIFWLISPFLDKGDLHGTRQRIDDTLGMIVKVGMWFLKIADLLINTVYRAFEAIPVVE